MDSKTDLAASAAPAGREEFLALLQRHTGIVRKVAASYTACAADRHDLEQEIVLQLWRAWPRYQPGRSYSTWMYRIALNVAISALRQASARPTVPLDEIAPDLAEESAGPAQAENAQLLHRLIATLAPLDRALLLLHLEDRGYPEIAAILGLSETNVATRLSRLKQTLRRELARLHGEPR
jgi:RNA polymerase sigma-70 factor (ECF subfamily)